MQEVRIVQKIYEYPSADGDKHCACFLLLEAEGKSLLIDHRLCTVSTQQEPLHTHSSVCGHEELLKAPVCSLANCFEGFTLQRQFLFDVLPQYWKRSGNKVSLLQAG